MSEKLPPSYASRKKPEPMDTLAVGGGSESALAAPITSLPPSSVDESPAGSKLPVPMTTKPVPPASTADGTSSDNDVDMKDASYSLEEDDDAEVKAAMATLSNAKSVPRKVVAKPTLARRSSDGSLPGKPRPRTPVWMRKSTPAQQALNHSKADHDDDDDDMETSEEEEDYDDEDEEDEMLVAIPAEDDSNGETVKVKKNGSGKKASASKSTKEPPKKKLKRQDSNVSTTSTTNRAKKGGGGGGGKRKTSGGPGSRSKGYQGIYRSAAAAHRKSQINIPPIGSPGLLMLPTPAATAAFPPIESEEEARKKWLIRDEYLLPSTVFKQSMIAGGYTLDKRRTKPHRGSSTERIVGDMFDSDAGGLYLHFPELIPDNVWERRLGDSNQLDFNDDVRPPPDPNSVASPGKATRREPSSGATALNKFADAASKNGNSKDETTKKGPKGARSSYIFFTNAQRPKMVAEYPGMRFTEQGVIMGERWRALTPEEKKPYEDTANRDKERYSREMKEYLESMKKEMQDEKSKKQEGGTTKVGEQSSSAKEEQDKGDENKDGASKTEEVSIDEKKKEETPKKVDKKSQKKKDNDEVKGPRLVDAMILSLSKMLGHKVNRKPTLPPTPPEEKEESASFEAKPEQVNSSGEPSSSAADSTPSNQPMRRVSPDLSLSELPQFTSSNPRKRSHPNKIHSPFSFADMIPISLTTAYPPSYVAKRKTYAEDVRKREDAIIDAQEAKDDADDAQEKFVSHTEAWERMLEYQKGLVAKREAERKEQKEKEAAEESEKKKAEEEAKNDSEGNAPNGSSDAGGDAKNIEQSDSENSKASTTGNGNSSSAAEKKVRAPSPPPEDPMECMPPRPKAPGPARVVSIPDIPIPPSPPPVVEMGHDNGGDCNIAGSIGDKDKEASKGEEANNSKVAPMLVPKLNQKILQHLDPSLFLPTMSEGRYFGLLSNHIADPQFFGPLAPSIAGTTYGGGTGLATSYVGGGRGAAGVVAGPSRGANLWQTLGSKSERRGSSKDSKEKTPTKEKATTKEKTATKEKTPAKEKTDTKEKAQEKTPDEVKSTKAILPKASTLKATPSFIAALAASAQKKAASAQKPTPPVAANSTTPVPDAVKSVSEKTVSPPAKVGIISSPKTPAPANPTSATVKRPASDVSPKKTATPTVEEPSKKKQKRTNPLGLATGDRNTTATEIAAGSAGPEFPDGWIVKTYRRSGGETVGKTDRFWFSPGKNIRFRARKHAKAFVEILIGPGVDGDEEKAAEVYRKKGLHF